MPDNERRRDKFKRHLLPSRTRLRSTSPASTPTPAPAPAPAPAPVEAGAGAEATQPINPDTASQGTAGRPAAQVTPSSTVIDQDAHDLATQDDTASAPVASTGDAAPQASPPSDAIWNDAIKTLERLKAKGSQDAEHALAFVQKLPKSTQNDPRRDIKNVSEYLESAGKVRDDSRSRNYFATAVSILKKPVGIGHAALPWAAVQAVITTVAASIELGNKTTESIAIIASLFVRCDFYATLYLATPRGTVVADSNHLDRLRDAIAGAYTKSLMILGYLDRLSSRNSARNHLFSSYTLVNVDTHIQGLEGCEHRLNQTGSECQQALAVQDVDKRREDAYEVLHAMTELHTALKTLHQPVISTYRQTVLSSLNSVDTAGFDQLNQKEVVKCLEDTRVNVLQMVDDWAGDVSSNAEIFWLEGLAGTGKSTISRTVADKLQRQGKLAGSFFFKRGAGDRAHGRRFFTTIACQLAGKLPSMFDHVAAVLNEVHDISSKNIETQFEALLEGPFGSQEGEPRLGNLIIVIDALDECEPSDLSMILPRLARTKLRCFITSRPGIQSTLYSDKLEEMEKIYLHKMDESVTREDIRKYLNFELAKLKKGYLGKRRQLPHDWPDGDTLNGLTDLATPLFIAAATIMRMLDAKHIPKSPVELTQDILQRRSNGLKGIESIYNQVLANLPPEFGDKFREVVGPIIIMFDHLNTTDLSSLLGMSESDIDHCISQLEEILDISDPEAPIRPFHLSLPDFLLGPSPRHEFQIDRQNANRQVASHCVRLLHKNLQKDVCNIGSPGCRASEVSPELIAECLPPPVQYACLCWIDHLKACGDQLQDHDETHMFLTAKFPMWLEALSWIGRLDESRRMVYDLQRLADSSAGELASFLEECRMFVSVFLPGVQEAPLQVYDSGLAFTPADSMLGQAFSNLRSSEWNVQVPSIPPNLSSSTHSFTSRKQIKSLSISEDGLLAWADESGIRVVDSRTGELVRELEWPYNKSSGELDFGAELAFGAEGQLATATWGTTLVWNLKTGQLLQTISNGVRFGGHKCLTFSKLDDRLCILQVHEFTNGSASKYDWKSGICQATRSFPLDSKDNVVLSPDGQWIGHSFDAGIRVLAFPKNVDEQGESYTCGDRICQIAFSTNGMLLAAEHVNQNRVTVWNRETGTVLREIDADYSPSQRIILTETMIYMGSEDGSITRWSLALGSITGTMAEQLFVYNSGVRHLAISERCNILASTSRNNVIRTWHSPVFLPLVQGFSRDKFGTLSLKFGYAGKTVESNGRQNIMIWDATAGSPITHIEMGVNSIAVTETAPHLAVNRAGSPVIGIYDPAFQELQHEYEIPVQRNVVLAMSADGERILSVGQLDDMTLHLHVYNLETCESEWDTELNIKGGLFGLELAFHADRSCTKIAVEDWNAAEIYTLDKTSGASGRYKFDRLQRLAFLSNGTQIMAMSWDGSGWVRDFENGTVLFEFKSPTNDVHRYVFHLGTFKKAVVPNKAYPPKDRLSALINSHHVSWDGRWIMNGTHLSLWLPEDFHRAYSTTSDSSLALYTEKRGLWILNRQEQHREHTAIEEGG